jgi:hypothetical protein
MKSKIVTVFMMVTLGFLLSGVCFANTLEGELRVLIPGHEANITFQKIDANKILVSALDTDLESHQWLGTAVHDYNIRERKRRHAGCGRRQGRRSGRARPSRVPRCSGSRSPSPRTRPRYRPRALRGPKAP